MKEKIFNALPFVFLVCGLLLTFSFYRKELRSHEQNQKTYYHDQITELRETISFRLQTYVDEQIAGAAFITASNEVTRQEWRKFVTALKLDINYPGINGLGLAVPVLKIPWRLCGRSNAKICPGLVSPALIITSKLRNIL